MLLSAVIFALYLTFSTATLGSQAPICFACHKRKGRLYAQRTDATGHLCAKPLDDTSSSLLNTDDSISVVTGVTLKLAVDTSGGVACRSEIKPERFTSPESLDMVHRLRASSDAVLVGVGTVLADNPSLLVRRNIPCVRQPLRVVIDPSLKLILGEPSLRSYQLLSDGYPVVIYHCQSIIADQVNGEMLPQLPSSIRLVYLEPIQTLSLKQLAVHDIVQDLRTRHGVRHLMVEGGPFTAQAFLRAEKVDRCLLVTAPVTFADPIPSGISNERLLETLSLVGSVSSGVDTIQYWSRPMVPWPTAQLRDWP